MVIARIRSWVLLLSAFSPPLAAQQPERPVTIRVIASDSSAIEGARVESGTAVAVTGADGRAVLRLPVGGVVVRITRIGFEPQTVSVGVTAAGAGEVTVVLRAAVVEAEEIIVTATRANRRIEDEPLRVEVVGREEIEEKLLMTPGDIAMLLNETSGLRVQATSPTVGGASIRVQGLRGGYTLLLADGLPLYGGQTSALGPLQIPPMDLAQVEVIKGAASALYGASALGGVVNLVSRRPAPPNEVLLNATTLGGGDGILWLADELTPEVGYTALAGAHAQQYADVDDDGWADLPEYRRLVVRPRVFWEDGRGTSVFGTLGGMIENRSGGTAPGGTTPDASTYREDRNSRRVDAGGVARLLDGGGRLVALRGSAQYQTNEHVYDTVPENDRLVTAFAEASVSATAGSHVWVVGGAAQVDAFRARDVPGFDFTYVVPGIFAQDEVRLTDVLLVSGSARADHHNVFGIQVSPRLSVMMRPPGWTIRASGGGGYSAPTPHTEEVEAVGLSRLDPLPPDLRVERAWSTSLDVGRAFTAVELNATVFAGRIDQPITTIRTDTGRLRITNAPEPVKTWGGELLARYHAEPIHLTATYAYTRATEYWAGTRREVPYTPRHTVGVVGAWENGDRSRIGAEFYYTGLQTLDDDPYRTESRPYVVIGVLVEHRFGPIRAFLNAENLLDARQTRWAPLVRPSRTPDGRWTTDVWAPLEGRVFNFGIRSRF